MSKSLGYKNTSSERTRKALSIEEKLEIIKRLEGNERTRDIARATGLKESTLRTIRDNAAKIK
jgi:transposase-like protein